MEQGTQEIASSKTKIAVIGASALMFIVMGVWLLRLPPDYMRHWGPLGHPYVVKAAGAGGVLFFGCVGLFALVKIFDSAPGLVLDQRGLLDRSSAVPVGFVPWRDVAGIEQFDLVDQRFVVIMLKNPEKYVAKSHPALRWIARINTRMCGSPVMLTPNALEVDFDQLYKMIEARLAQYRATSNH
jgi:hypothetical protein